MQEGMPSAVYRKDYEPPEYLVATIDLHFSLEEDVTVVRASQLIRKNPLSNSSSNELVINGSGLKLLSISLDQRELHADAYAVVDDELRIYDVPEKFLLEVSTEITPQTNTALEGLYKSQGMYCTQCEAEGFRRITYFLDRPDVMARYTTTIVADKLKYPVLLSNGNKTDSGDLDNGKHWAKWEDPFPKPSYLFALVAGDLSCQAATYTTASGREVKLEIFVEPTNIDKCEHAIASLKKAMKWDEQVYGCEYDLDIYMIVAVNHFNMGAMENKGLNIFNAACVLANPQTATDADYESIESIIAHEYFHNWTGNRVTCRDWFQLSLKEGLTVFRDQEFSADMISRPVKRISDVNILRTMQFPQDAGPMAHPIRPDSFIDISNFYTVTVYNKGAEVIRMIHTLLGQAGFRKGMDLYFQRHDGQAVTTDDFIQAMQDANSFDFSGFKNWYRQAGTPTVKVSSSHDAVRQEYTLSFSQGCAATPDQAFKDNFHIPIQIGLLDKFGADISLIEVGENAEQQARDSILELTEAETHFCFSGIKEKPLPSLLRSFSAPVNIEYAYTDDELMFLLANDNDAFNRWEAGQRLATRVINRLILSLQEKRDLILSTEFIETYAGVLNNTDLDGSLISQALSLPNEIYLAELQSMVDPTAIHAAREFVCNTLSEKLETKFSEVFHDLDTQAEYQFNAAEIARRSLKNLCLSYLMRRDDPDIRQLAFKQYHRQDNMTDVIAALSGFVKHRCDETREVLDDFYKQWKHDHLVVNKWFALQARSSHDGALDDVKQLMQHAAFDLTNPNNVRAVIGGFCFGNPVNFHRQDGAGYAFLTHYILQLNNINPQIAARLVSAFSQWRRFDEARKDKMKTQLETILGSDNLPKDVFEIVSKSLNG